MNLTKQQRLDLRMKFGGKCAYCGCDLPEKGWHADHVEAVRREWWKSTQGYKDSHGWRHEVVNGKIVRIAVPLEKAGLERPENDTLDNLFPSCRPCNIDKHCMSLEDWRQIVADKVGVLRRNYKAFSHAERFGLVAATGTQVVFWFEKWGAVQPGGKP